MKIKEALQWGYQELNHTSDSARLDAELLLSYLLKKSATFLLAQNDQPLDLFRFFPIRRLVFKWLIGWRKKGVPVAYLVGHKEFYMLEFEVNPAVLIPRPDTEFLAEEVIGYLRRSLGADGHPRFQLVDVGTGSGCIPISVLKNVEGLEAIATDISGEALKVARRNARKHGVESRIRFVRSDLLEDVAPEMTQGREVILIANLPYLPEKMPVSPELTFEPSISLFGGADGMDIYRRFIDGIRKLQPKAVFLELFQNQVSVMESSLPGYRTVECKALSGEARCLAMERK